MIDLHHNIGPKVDVLCQDIFITGSKHHNLYNWLSCVGGLHPLLHSVAFRKLSTMYCRFEEKKKNNSKSEKQVT
jgi:hypothetical protein